MKKMLLLLFTAANILLYAQQTDVVSVGAGYANDVFYSFATGEVKTEPRNNWHIAFTTKIVGASVLVNEGLGVELYVASTNVSDWATLDTTGMTWAPLHNSPATWEEGAFNATATVHPDYGWGVYSNITHNVTATKIFVLKLPDGSYRKVIIDDMKTNGDFNIRLANLDGSNLLTKTFNKNGYSNKNFFYWDVINDTILDREPNKTDWDILFTRYLEEIIPNTYYPVSGVILNYDVLAAKAEGVDTNTVDWNNYMLSDSILGIGSNWKSFNNGTFQWELADSLAYFVQGLDGNLYKLIFKDFGGSSTGNITFAFSMVSAIGLDEQALNTIAVYPQPATEQLTVEVDVDVQSSLSLYALNGANVLSTHLTAGKNILDVSHLPAGIYVAQLNSNNSIRSFKLVIQ